MPENLNGNAAMGMRIALGGAAGLMFGLWVLPWELVTGSGAFWQLLDSDRAAALIGYLYFVADDWRWPLYAIGTLELPEGTSVVFTDSVPVIALAMKVLHAFGMPAWNYFGVWLLSCYVLNGVAMALVLWCAGVRSSTLTLLSALLATGMPVLLHRWYHLALCGQFLILLSFACYVAVARARRPESVLGAAALLVVVSLGVHPYLWAMVFALYVATLARAGRTFIPLRRTAYHLALTCLVLAGLMLALGYVSVAGPLSAAGEGYGYFSANLVSPFVSSLSGLSVHAWEGLRVAEAEGSTWPFYSSARPDATGGQFYEGFGYLGLGLLALCALHIPYVIRNGAYLARQHWPLLGVLAGAMLFAVSNRAYLGDYLVAAIPIPSTLTALAGVFRSSGRFLWIVAYAALVGATILTARRFGTRGGAGVLALALALQLLDTAPLRQAIRLDARSTHTAGLSLPDWTRWFSAGFDRLYIVPSYACGEPHLGNRKLALQYIAARVGPIPTNSASNARSRKVCAEEMRLLDLMAGDARTTWVFFADGLRQPEVERFTGSSDMMCRFVGEALACKRR